MTTNTQQGMGQELTREQVEDTRKNCDDALLTLKTKRMVNALCDSYIRALPPVAPESAAMPEPKIISNMRKMPWDYKDITDYIDALAARCRELQPFAELYAKEAHKNVVLLETLSKAEAELQEMRADAERLDWLLKYAYGKTLGVLADWDYLPITTRAQIDAAMAKGVPSAIRRAMAGEKE